MEPDLFERPTGTQMTGHHPMTLGHLLYRAPIAQATQYEEADPARLLCPLSSFGLGLVFTRDVIVPR